MSTRKHILPGFSLSLGVSVLYLSVVVLLPLSTIVVTAGGMEFSSFWKAVSGPRVLSAYVLSFGAAFLAAVLNVFCGVLTAWVLVRYRFPGRQIIDALIDLPFALPTAVAGIALTTLLAPQGWVGAVASRFGVEIAFTPLGIFAALVFVSFPFVVRSVQPVLADFAYEVEEAAATLGASPLYTFLRVILPSLLPAILTGFSLSFARSLGEYGSVVFISGNLPHKTEIVPLLIMTRLEQYDVQGATALAVVMLLSSFVILVLLNAVQIRFIQSRSGGS